jgi:hypothetical protein
VSAGSEEIVEFCRLLAAAPPAPGPDVQPAVAACRRALDELAARPRHPAAEVIDAWQARPPTEEQLAARCEQLLADPEGLAVHLKPRELVNELFRVWCLERGATEPAEFFPAAAEVLRAWFAARAREASAAEPPGAAGNQTTAASTVSGSYILHLVRYVPAAVRDDYRAYLVAQGQWEELRREAPDLYPLALLRVLAGCTPAESGGLLGLDPDAARAKLDVLHLGAPEVPAGAAARVPS